MSTDTIDPSVQPPVGPDTTAERIPDKQLSKWTLYTRRFMRNKPAVGGIVIFVVLALCSIIVPIFSPYTVTDMDFLNLSTGPSAEHWFGTNASGNDTFTQTFVGLQRSLMIAVVVSVGVTAISAIVGTAAAYFGGRVERGCVACAGVMVGRPELFL